MKLTNKELGLSLSVNARIMGRLVEHGQRHYPNEFGGLLVGRYSENKQEVTIEDTILPKRFVSSRSGFERQTSDLRQTLESFYLRKPSLYYVGEWHTHPDCAAVPSTTDIHAMKTIIASPEIYIESPVLLIISITQTMVVPKFYIYYNGFLNLYEK